MLYCTTHGRAHYPGETDNVALVGDELDCREEEWSCVPGQVEASQCEPTDETGGYYLTTGSLAYLDTLLGGLVPVKILSLGLTEAMLQVTAGRVGYERNEVVPVSLPNHTLVHRSQVYRSGGIFRVNGRPTLMTDGGVIR